MRCGLPLATLDEKLNSTAVAAAVAIDSRSDGAA